MFVFCWFRLSHLYLETDLSWLVNNYRLFIVYIIHYYDYFWFTLIKNQSFKFDFKSLEVHLQWFEIKFIDSFITIFFAWNCPYKDTFFSSYRNIFQFFDSILSIGFPMFFEFSSVFVSLIWCEPIQTAVRSLYIVKFHCFTYCRIYLWEAGECHSMQ